MQDHFYDLLPDGSTFSFWHPQEEYTKTYFVKQQHPNASDENPGTIDRPFKTINRAAEVLMPGERVVIGEGVYKEFVRPVRGGTGPEAMISYEAAPGENVVLSGLETWKSTFVPSEGWKRTGQFGQHLFFESFDEDARVWKGNLDFKSFEDCNPFAMLNVPSHPFGDCPFFFDYKPRAMDHREFMMRRGLLFCDGKLMRQVETSAELWQSPGTYWVEDGGLTIHFRLFEDDSPEHHTLSYTSKSQLFAPLEPYFGYIRVKELTFEYVGNGFPGSQKGALSTYCGHHWVIEQNTVRWANSIGIDTGHESPMRESDKPAGFHIIRNNLITDCGLCGLCGVPSSTGYQSVLIEHNRFERNCWHNTEIMWESGAIKVHVTNDCLIRHNIILDNMYGPTIWTDYNNRNTRICGNVVIDAKKTLLGSIFVEASHYVNQVDNNVIINVGADYTMVHSGNIEPGGHADAEGGGHAIYEHDADYLVVENNFVSGAQGSAVFMNNDANEGRIVNGRGSLGRKIRIQGNIIDNCHGAILLPNEDNFSDYNVFAKILNRGGSCRIQHRQQRFNLRAWREFLGWDVNGKEATITSQVDKTELTLYVRIESGEKIVDQTIDLSKVFTIKELVQQLD